MYILLKMDEGLKVKIYFASIENFCFNLGGHVIGGGLIRDRIRAQGPTLHRDQGARGEDAEDPALEAG